MQTLTGAKPFAPGQRGPRKTKDWFERAKLVVAAARDRAVETAQQRAAPSIKRPPTVWQRQRLAERLAKISLGVSQKDAPVAGAFIPASA